jgi:hypothetical protein
MIHGESIAEGIPGGVYEIVEDETNPPLSNEEKTAISFAVYDALQKGTPFKQVWSSVALAHPEIAGKRNPKQLSEAHDNANAKVVTHVSSFAT